MYIYIYIYIQIYVYDARLTSSFVIGLTRRLRILDLRVRRKRSIYGWAERVYTHV